MVINTTDRQVSPDPQESREWGRQSERSNRCTGHDAGGPPIVPHHREILVCPVAALRPDPYDRRRVQLFQMKDLEGNPVMWDSMGAFDGVTSSCESSAHDASQAQLLTELTEQQVLSFNMFLLV